MATFQHASPRTAGLSLARSLRGRPTIGVEVAAAIAWGALVAMFSGRWLAHHAQTGPTPWWCMPGMELGSASSGVGASVLRDLPMWTLMSTAMMLPAAIPATRRLAPRGGRWRGQRAILEFLAAYLAIWLVFGAVALAVRTLWAPPGRVSLIVALALASAWQLTPRKRLMLDRCRNGWAIPPGGWGSLGAVRLGIRNGGACLGACWAMMLVMVVATSGQLIWSVAIATAVVTERLMRRPQGAIQCISAILGAIAFDVALLAAIA